jgi:hypothetical protein
MDDETTVVFYVIDFFAFVFMGCFPAAIAHGKGRNFWLWLIFSIPLWPLLSIIVLFIESRDPPDRRMT